MNNDIFQKNVKLLSECSPEEQRAIPCNDAALPSVDKLREIIDLIKTIIFPGFFDKRQSDATIHSYHIGVNMELLYKKLKEQIGLALIFNSTNCEKSATEASADLSIRFIDSLPELKRLLYTDVEAIFINDQAVHTRSEVIFCYPVIEAMIHYRVAHILLRMGIPVIPRIITEQAHAKTGIDIHPGAQIGEYFAIGHGTGVVIGETCVIGRHVTLYQGVTLGAINYKLEADRRPTKAPRHPVLEDNVTIYSNSTLLGHITIGHDTVIGGNIWLTHSVSPHSRLMQSKALDVSFTGGLGI